LNDLSLTVPVSDTRQALNAAAGALLDEPPEPLLGVLPPPPPPLEPHAAASNATADRPAMHASLALTVASSATAAGGRPCKTARLRAALATRAGEAPPAKQKRLQPNRDHGVS
jgi:hypothetical protein